MDAYENFMRDYERIRENIIKLNPSGKDNILDKFIRETFCPLAYDKEGAFYPYIEPIIFCYERWYNTPETQDTVKRFLAIANEIALHLRNNFNLPDDDCERIQNKVYINHPFDLRCGLLENAPLYNLSQGKKLWLEILDTATTVTISDIAPKPKYSGYKNFYMESVSYIINYLDIANNHIENSVPEELMEKIFSEFLKIKASFEKAPPKYLHRYLSFLDRYYLNDLEDEKWEYPSQHLKYLRDYFDIPSQDMIPPTSNLIPLDEQNFDTFELLVQDLGRLYRKGGKSSGKGANNTLDNDVYMLNDTDIKLDEDIILRFATKENQLKKNYLFFYRNQNGTYKVKEKLTPYAAWLIYYLYENRNKNKRAFTRTELAKKYPDSPTKNPDSISNCKCKINNILKDKDVKDILNETKESEFELSPLLSCCKNVHQ